ncbi:MAG: M16 family metallopeptidase, partial [Candidatus Lutacidiplasmatales archaeon]
MGTERTDPLRVEREELPNGLTVVRQPPPAGASTFSATFVAPSGWSYDRAGLEGLARVTSDLLPSGAGKRSRVELARFLDSRGGSLGSHADPESVDVSVHGPSTEWEPLIRVLADAVLRPRFDPEDIARVKRQMHERQLRELSQPGERVEREFLREVFPVGHPYRLTGLGTSSALRRIGRPELRGFHSSHYVPEGAFLVVTTPRPLADVRRAGRRLFDDFAQEKAPPT